MRKGADSLQADQTLIPKGSAWRGLGFWNFYFLGKVALYLSGHMGFDLFYNAIFLAALLLPLKPLWLHRLRNVIAIPFGVSLFYYDTWFPPFSRLTARPEVLEFSNDYILELLGRFINWELVGLGFVFFVAYLFLNQWLRLTFFTVLAMLFVTESHFDWLRHLDYRIVSGTTQVAAAQREVTEVVVSGSRDKDQPPTASLSGSSLNALLNNELNIFYEAESKKAVALQSNGSGELPFDLVFINICSMSWADLEATQLVEHQFFKNMNVIFDDFNSVTTYSGPAVMRLMYATCGQRSHEELYTDIPQQCRLFDNLRGLGFETSVALNQTGDFQNFKNTLSKADPVSEPFLPTELKPALRSFYDEPIWGDHETLSLWMEKQNFVKATKPQALLYNTVTLHDGNREATDDGASRPSPYETRANKLLNDLQIFLEELEQSGRKVLVVIIPEHGAALAGDRMQIPGMREIPTPEITHVPVGVRLVGVGGDQKIAPVHVAGPTSFQALTELISRLLKVESSSLADVNWSDLIKALPETKVVSENEGVVMMTHEGQPYVRMQGRNWIRYEP